LEHFAEQNLPQLIAVIIWPTINHWKLSRPVTVDVLYRCSPFEGIRIPWILNRFLSVEYTTEKLYKILIETHLSVRK
jgi:hypothetical protein